MKSKIETSGSIEYNGKELNDKYTRKIQRAIKETAKAIEVEAKANCPVRTGTLRDSIRHTIADDGMSAEIGSDIHYAPYVEFGTRKMAAQPFLFPAIERFRHLLANTIKRVIGKT